MKLTKPHITVKSGLTGSGFSGSTGQDARSLQISYPLHWEDSGLTGFGLSGQRFCSHQTNCIVLLPVYPVFYIFDDNMFKSITRNN